MIKDEKEHRKMMFHGFKIALFMYIRFGKPMRKAGGIDKLHTNRIRYNFQFISFFR
jgi:hypothetical protein